MSDSRSPESATASSTAVSACAASGTSAERVTFEKPTPLTATLHRFSHIWAFLLRPGLNRAAFETAASRLPQDEVFLNAIEEVRHPEEVRSAVSKDAGFRVALSFSQSCAQGGTAEM